ncbi:DUF7563 family protein [Halomarina pelagica]|uniref:DUF7563 family protein n=1 Tax=Halomarina pelagica TaxID=2961599 RepID=UPI0020C5328D|nr:hypothetical protein [Halomarina sp. BND7]
MAGRMRVAEQRACLHCGRHVSRDFRRTFGDNENRAHRCRNCDTHTRIAHGSAAGVTVDIPDPETSLGRHGDGSDQVVDDGGERA